jgi:hypothetical protein
MSSRVSMNGLLFLGIVAGAFMVGYLVRGC